MQSIVVCTYRLVMISIKWSETAQENALASADIIVTQLLHYHMPLLYFVCNHLIVVLFSCKSTYTTSTSKLQLTSTKPELRLALTLTLTLKLTHLAGIQPGL